MAKRLLAGLFSLLLLFSLTGCAGFTYKNINELLRAPALGGGLDEIQKALLAFAYFLLLKNCHCKIDCILTELFNSKIFKRRINISHIEIFKFI